jgi:hypothetical protein
MASKIFALLSNKAQKVIERQSNEYTWKDANGVDEEMDGMTIIALAQKVIEHQSNEYTWKDANGVDEEMDGMTITALILWHLRPHHKVDMYSEIGAVKEITIAQFDNHINLFFDAIRSSKL